MVESSKPGDYEYDGPEPLNREPPLDDLLSSFITPASVSYDRNHSDIPQINEDTYVLSICGLVNKPIKLTLHDLKTKFQQHTILATVCCAGNRRHTMRTTLKEVDGIDWFDGAIMNSEWSGPLIRDILLHAGLPTATHPDLSTLHLTATSHALPCQDAPVFAASIPLPRALDRSAECILAHTHNGTRLSGNHGAPLRTLCPGLIGARSVKWVDELCVAAHESPNFYVKRDYRMLPAAATTAREAERGGFWDAVPPMLDVRVNAVVGVPREGQRCARDENACVRVRGYAVPSGLGGPVRRVCVSGDGGVSWVDAVLSWGRFATAEEVLVNEEVRNRVRWSWALWEARVPVQKGKVTIFCKAIDWSGQEQMKECDWNLRGVGYNAWGRVNIEVV